MTVGGMDGKPTTPFAAQGCISLPYCTVPVMHIVTAQVVTHREGVADSWADGGERGGAPQGSDGEDEGPVNEGGGGRGQMWAAARFRNHNLRDRPCS